MLWSYLPILKWKQGEEIALRHLTTAQWDKVVPLIELLPIASASDGPTLRAALKPYLDAIVKKIMTSIPEDKVIVIDTRYVSIGYKNQLDLLRVVCLFLAKGSGRTIIPALNEKLIGDGSTSFSPMAVFNELVLRIATNSVASSQVAPLIAKLATDTGSQIHALIDQFALVGVDPAAASLSVTPYLTEALSSKASSVTLAGGSFPVNLMGFKQGTYDITRIEWLVWNALRATLAFEKVLFSDYSVSHPELQPEMDPKKVNPSVQIRYCTTGKWRLFKAGGFKLGQPNQYRNLCLLLLGDPVYSGRPFSYGDACYDDASTGAMGNGNPSSWRRDATNHHIAFTRSTV